jgi:hypothetical protein
MGRGLANKILKIKGSSFRQTAIPILDFGSFCDAFQNNQKNVA